MWYQLVFPFLEECYEPAEGEYFSSYRSIQQFQEDDARLAETRRISEAYLLARKMRRRQIIVPEEESRYFCFSCGRFLSRTDFATHDTACSGESYDLDTAELFPDKVDPKTYDLNYYITGSQYYCCCCDNIFPVSRGEDDFPEGLCPHCTGYGGFGGCPCDGNCTYYVAAPFPIAVPRDAT